MITAQSFEILRARIGFIFFTLAVTLSTTLIFSLLLPNKYTAEATFVVHFKETGLDKAFLPQRLAESYLKTQIDIINSPNVALKVVDRLNLTQRAEFIEGFDLDDPGLIRQQLANQLLENLEVEPSRESRMLTITYTAKEPNVAAEIANAFTQSYIDTNLELSVNPAQRSAEWFLQELDRSRSQLQLAQEKLSAHEQKHGILTEDTKSDMNFVQLNELSRSLVEAQIRSSLAEANFIKIQELLNDPSRLALLPEVQSNDFVQGIKLDLLRKETELSEINSRLGKNHPQYQRVRAEVLGLRRKLNREIKQIAEGVNQEAKQSAQLARDHEQKILNEIQTKKESLMGLKQNRDLVPAMQQEVRLAQNLYESVLLQYNERNLKSRLKITNVAILSEAVPPLKKSSPKLLQNLIVGMALGLFLGIGFALMLENSDTIIRTEHGLAEVIDAPLLGYLEHTNYLTYTGNKDS